MSESTVEQDKVSNALNNVIASIDAVEPFSKMLSVLYLLDAPTTIEKGLLSRDSLSESRLMYEKAIDDGITSSLPPNFNWDLFHLAHSKTISELKRKALAAADDTGLTNDLGNYHRILKEEGFEKVLELDFTDPTYKYPEKFFVFFRRKGALLLVHDTYNTTRVNSAKIYYNWKRKYSAEKYVDVTSSGNWNIKDRTGEVPYEELYPKYEKTTDPDVLAREKVWHDKWNREAVWSGDHDAREALRRIIFRLEEHGTFLDKWEFSSFLWLLHYGDTKVTGYNYKTITKERVAMLPDYVREAIIP